MPFCAPLPVATINATGVASPSAHGQLMTSTEMAKSNELNKPLPVASHTTSVTREIAITTGTNTDATLSASFWMGALDVLALSTREIILERVLSSPTEVTSICTYPLTAIAPPTTTSPVCFSTGMGSPVRALWSTKQLPLTMRPSQGIVIPALTTTTSPTFTVWLSTVVSTPSTSTIALLGARFFSLDNASPVLRLELFSKYLPRLTSAKIMAEDSK